MEYTAIFKDINGNIVRKIRVEAGSESNAYYQALGHALAADMFPKIKIKRAN